MRVLLATYDSRGGVEPLLGLAVRLRELIRPTGPPGGAALAAMLLADQFSRERMP